MGMVKEIRIRFALEDIKQVRVLCTACGVIFAARRPAPIIGFLSDVPIAPRNGGSKMVKIDAVVKELMTLLEMAHSLSRRLDLDDAPFSLRFEIDGEEDK